MPRPVGPVLRIACNYWPKTNGAPVNKKAPEPEAPGQTVFSRYDLVQVRVRARIWYVSKEYSATCHHRYWSLRNATKWS